MKIVVSRAWPLLLPLILPAVNRIKKYRKIGRVTGGRIGNSEGVKDDRARDDRVIRRFTRRSAAVQSLVSRHEWWSRLR